MPSNANHRDCRGFGPEEQAAWESRNNRVQRATLALTLQAEARIRQKGRRALILLLEAHEYACQLQQPSWQFAVEIQCLRTAGLSHSDLRWLLCTRLLRHAYETTMPEDAARRFCKRVSPSFSPASCFALTKAGVVFVRHLLELSAAEAQSGSAAVPPASTDQPAAKPVPQWDPQRRELCFGGQLVKQFKAPATNQEMILAAFEEEQWPPRIDDPLPPRADLDPKRRLHATINSLNRKQKNALIRFLGDGTGEGLRWELASVSARDVPVAVAPNGEAARNGKSSGQVPGVDH
jgi:hypothetical protein